MSAPALHVRALRETDLPVTARLHARELAGQFVPDLGEDFLRRYQRFWLASPFAIAQVAEAETGVVAVLLGSVNPAAHYNYLLRRHGVGLALGMLAAVARDRGLLRRLLHRRLRRYLRALARRGAALLRRRRPGTVAPPPPTGEVTVVAVAVTARRRGAARALLAVAEEQARAAGAGRLELVTPPGGPGEQLYRALGWRQRGGVAERETGEQFLHFERELDRPG